MIQERARWETFAADGSPAAWDEPLESFAGFTLYQLHGWGEHRAQAGWRVHRWLARDPHGSVVAMVQGLYRPLAPGAGMLWATGVAPGALGAWGPELRRRLLRDTGAPLLYARVNFTTPTSEVHRALLRELGWRPAAHRLRSGHSMRLNLSQAEAELAGGLTKNWRRNLKRAEKQAHVVDRWERPDIGEMLALYASMEQYKEIAQQFSADELRGLFRHFGERIVVYQTRSAGGSLLALRGCAHFRRHAWDLFAATRPEGRDSYAAYRCCWELLLHARKLGVQFYDLMGVELEGDKVGVYNFKKGTGAELVEYLGEWEWSSFGPLRWAANQVLKRRRIA